MEKKTNYNQNRAIKYHVCQFSLSLSLPMSLSVSLSVSLSSCLSLSLSLCVSLSSCLSLSLPETFYIVVQWNCFKYFAVIVRSFIYSLYVDQCRIESCFCFRLNSLWRLKITAWTLSELSKLSMNGFNTVSQVITINQNIDYVIFLFSFLFFWIQSTTETNEKKNKFNGTFAEINT